MLFAPKEKGQGLVEYAVAIIVVLIIATVVYLTVLPIVGRLYIQMGLPCPTWVPFGCGVLTPQ